jgi:hypothetical protein
MLITKSLFFSWSPFRPKTVMNKKNGDWTSETVITKTWSKHPGHHFQTLVTISKPLSPFPNPCHHFKPLVTIFPQNGDQEKNGDLVLCPSCLSDVFSDTSSYPREVRESLYAALLTAALAASCVPLDPSLIL